MMRSPQTVKIVNKRYTVFYRMAKLRHLAKQKLDVYLFHNNHQVRFHKKTIVIIVIVTGIIFITLTVIIPIIILFICY